MNFPVSAGALLISLSLAMPVQAQMYGPSSSSSVPAPYPYFRRVSSSSSSSSSVSSLPAMPAPVAPMVPYASSSSVSVPAITDQPRVGLALTSERNEATPGDDVRYWVEIHNLYSHDLPQWQIAFFFDPKQMQILDAGGGRVEGDHIRFTVPPMSSGAQRSYSVRVHLYRNLTGGTLVRTYGSMIWDGSISPACSENTLQIIARPPMTGADEDAVSPVEDTSRFLTPMPQSNWLSSLLKLFSW